MQEGDKVIVVGNPEGFVGTVVECLISAIRMNGALFQISAPISEGSSGSPVFNEDGYVVGIATMMMTKQRVLCQRLEIRAGHRLVVWPIAAKFDKNSLFRRSGNWIDTNNTRLGSPRGFSNGRHKVRH